MKTSYDFSFLTSPRDPRLDNWIGQPFALSYLNSELGTNFAFRYRPFGITGGLLEHRIKPAEKVLIKGGVQDIFVPFSSREKADVSAIQPVEYVFSSKWAFSGVISRTFEQGIKEVSALLTIFRLWGITENEADHLSGFQVGNRTNEEHTNLVLDYYDIKGERRQDLKDTLKVLDKYIPSTRETKNGITDHFNLFNLVNPKLETIVLGKLMINYMKQYREAIDYNDLLVVEKQQKVTLKDFESQLSKELTLYGYSDYPLLNVDKPIGEVVRTHYINASEQENRDATKGEYLNAISDDNIAVAHWGIQNGLKFELEGTVQESSNSEKNNFLNISTILESLLVDKTVFKEGINTSVLLIDEINANEGLLIQEIQRAEYGSDEARLLTHDYADKNIKENDSRFIDIMYVDTFSSEAHITNLLEAMDTVSIEGLLYDLRLQVSPEEKTGRSHASDLVRFDLTSYEAVKTLILTNINKVEQKGIKQDSNNSVVMMDLISVHAMISDIIVYADELREELLEGFIVQDIKRVEKILLSSRPTDMTTRLDRHSKDSHIDMVDRTLSMVPKNAEDIHELEVRVTKIKRESLLQMALYTVSHMDKITIIQQNWQLFIKYVKNGYLYNERASNENADLAIKELKRSSLIDNVVKTDKELKDTVLRDMLMADYIHLDGYITDMLGDTADRDEYWQEAIKNLSSIGHVDTENIGTKTDMKLSTSEQSIAVISSIINARDSFENSKQGFIPKQQFVLSGDGSDWEDIWTRYSPGVDILDPPDADFDYSVLAAKVYNLETGVPYKPKSPTNVPDVKVLTPLHHPLPEQFDLGIDDGKALAVDNYIFIDIVLALESLKNRNKLRYAGMPAEKTMRELFSKLFTWIQQAASSGEEYDRMFRFCRWYAESIVIQLSSHMLHREYTGWRSRFHLSEDLGLPHTTINWDYFSSAQVAQTTSEHAEYKFIKQNYIDGQLILRGYFDNPLGQGTMKIRIDGVEIDSFSMNGSFTRTLDVPQGNHTYEFIFDGESGRVSISTIEISGTDFVSAHTTSDDSDTNGLKASSLLINHLLAYFDKHHGGGKTKGTMEIKQRGVWNTHT